MAWPAVLSWPVARVCGGDRGVAVCAHVQGAGVVLVCGAECMCGGSEIRSAEVAIGNAVVEIE